MAADTPAHDRADAARGVGAIGYGGLVTRAIAFGIDGLVIGAVTVVVGLLAGLALSLLRVPSDAAAIAAAVGAVACVLWTIVYFVTFWATTGQTPGARLMRIRVVDAHTGTAPLKPRRGVVRLIGMTLSAIPLFAGFLLVLVDDRRRGLHDRLARTLVLELRRSTPPARPERTTPTPR